MAFFAPLSEPAIQTKSIGAHELAVLDQKQKPPRPIAIVRST